MRAARSPRVNRESAACRSKVVFSVPRNPPTTTSLGLDKEYQVFTGTHGGFFPECERNTGTPVLQFMCQHTVSKLDLTPPLLPRTHHHCTQGENPFGH